jgi:hypothetical protein
MAAILKKIKLITIRIILSLLKERWNNRGGLKVMITVNDYFNEARWKDTFTWRYKKESQNWDIVFCKNRFDVVKHFSSADICFLYGYGSHLMIHNTKPKLLYFPLLGLDFLVNKQIPGNFKIEKPPAYSARSIAEYCISMTIVLSRNMQYTFYNQRIKKWDQKPVLCNSFVSISSMKIGILGVGNVGKVIAKHFKKLGCFVTGCDKNVIKDLTFIDKWFYANELRIFLETIDVLIVALPLDGETRNLIGIEELKSLGSASYLINISRGDIINEKDLIKVLKTKIIKGAVLDTFTHEPLSRTSAFYNLDNLIITPHISGNINLFVNKIQEDFIIKVQNYSANV